MLTPHRVERLHLAGRLPAPALLRRAARRRLARDQPRRVRPRGRRGARARRAGDPRRSRAVPLRDLDAREHARVRRAARDDAAEAQGGRERPRSRRRASPCSRSRSASGTAPFDAALQRYVDFLTADGALEVEIEIDPAIPLAPGRADRGLPDRPGRARERPPARGRTPGRGLDRPAARAGASSASATTASASTAADAAAGQGLKNMRSARRRSTAASRSAHAPGAAPRSRSSSEPESQQGRVTWWYRLAWAIRPDATCVVFVFIE